MWYSKEWDNSPHAHSVFFIKDGHAIHGSYEVKSLGKPVSHGCVRISPENATLLYALVKEKGLKNTKVVPTMIMILSRSGKAAFSGAQPAIHITTSLMAIRRRADING